MLIRRDDGFEIDTSTERLDRLQVHRWLSTDAYWALGRPVETVSRSIDNSLCFGVYDPTGTPCGFARAVTDSATFAWLCDVYIAPAARAAGLGTWLAQAARAHLFSLGIRRVLLATQDAHGVYAKAGFHALDDPARWMEILREAP